MDIDTLRKNVKKLMVDRGLDKKGSIEALSKELGFNARSLSMALTGFRNGPASRRYLELLNAYLD